MHRGQNMHLGRATSLGPMSVVQRRAFTGTVNPLDRRCSPSSEIPLTRLSHQIERISTVTRRHAVSRQFRHHQKIDVHTHRALSTYRTMGESSADIPRPTPAPAAGRQTRQQPWLPLWPYTPDSPLHAELQLNHPQVLSWQFNSDDIFDHPWQAWKGRGQEPYSDGNASKPSSSAPEPELASRFPSHHLPIHSG